MGALRVIDQAADIQTLPPGTGAVTRALSAKLTERPSVLDFGAKGDGVTDDTAAIQAAINAVIAAGGALFFPAANYVVAGALTFPNDGATPPKQRALRLTGAGALMYGAGQAPDGGTILLMSYNGGGPAKIDTRGSGYLEIDGITFRFTGSGDTTPILQTTNTTLHIHDCAFFGAAGLGKLTCTQDALILGGVTQNLDGSATAAFQGYGTVIRDNFFDRIRRAVYGRTYCNNVVIAGNTLWNACGSNLTGGAGIEFVGLAGNTCSGNVVRDNLLEVGGYPYPIKADYTLHSTFAGNSFFDAAAATLAYYRMEANATYNLIMMGYGADSKPSLSDVSGVNTFITPHQSLESIFPAYVRFPNNALFASGFGPSVYDSGNNQWTPLVTGTAGIAWDLAYKVNGGANETVFRVTRLSASSYQIQLQNAGTNSFQSLGTLRLRANTGATLSLGDPANECTILNGALAIKTHLNAIANSDLSGTATVAGGTASISVVFHTAFASAPVVVAVPTSDPGARYWITTLTTGFTITVGSAPAGAVVFNWVATGNPN